MIFTAGQALGAVNQLFEVVNVISRLGLLY
jgi:hypothetical protein